MPVTITLDDGLLSCLRAQARARKLSVEQWAMTILGHAAEGQEEGPDAAQAWMGLNSRRLALIHKQYQSRLSRQEKKELDKLQDAAAKVFEPADRRRQDHVLTLMQKAVGARR